MAFGSSFSPVQVGQVFSLGQGHSTIEDRSIDSVTASLGRLSINSTHTTAQGVGGSVIMISLNNHPTGSTLTRTYAMGPEILGPFIQATLRI